MNKSEFLSSTLLCFVRIKAYLSCEVCTISLVDTLANANAISDVLS